MVTNIEEVLQRGEALSGEFWLMVTFICTKYNYHKKNLILLSALDTKASNLLTQSKKYRSDAKYLNTRSTYAKLAAVAVFVITLIIYVRFWWL